jgi:hypothetical protein
MARLMRVRLRETKLTGPRCAPKFVRLKLTGARSRSMKVPLSCSTVSTKPASPATLASVPNVQQEMLRQALVEQAELALHQSTHADRE